MILSYWTTSNWFVYLACNPNPCKNGGTCADADSDRTAECTCTGGFSGDTCDIPAGKIVV